MAIAQTPLRGKALLQKIKELQHLPRRETARQCGYVTGEGDSEQVNLTDFYNAVLTAKGIELDPEKTKDGRGREATYRVSVHANGQIVIGSSYTQKLQLKPGDELELKLGYKHIYLRPMVSDKPSGDKN